MDKYKLNDPKTLGQLWKRVDGNGNGCVSLAEFDKLAVDMCASGAWPPMDKHILMRAFKKADLLEGDGDELIEKGEFYALLMDMFWMVKIWDVFRGVDTGGDSKISPKEFVEGMNKLDLNLQHEEAEALFKKVDLNHDGQIMFTEFEAYVRERVTGRDASQDADVVSGQQGGKNIRKSKGQQPKRAVSGSSGKSSGKGAPPSLKTMKQFDECEVKIKAMIKDQAQLKALWGRLDNNPNGMVSLAELGKWVRDQYPVLDHAPALNAAHAASHSVNPDFVTKKDFKTLLGNLFYFNKVFWIFDHSDADHDKRIDKHEFQQLLVAAGVTMNAKDVDAEFKKVDKDGGGVVLFKEFCQYISSKLCPECFTDALEA